MPIIYSVNNHIQMQVLMSSFILKLNTNEQAQKSVLFQNDYRTVIFPEHFFAAHQRDD